MEYNKLVRDKIPEIIKRDNHTPITHNADESEYHESLRAKLNEETTEFLQSGNDEELADILEVVYALAETKNISKAELEEMRKQRAHERGSFQKRIILERVE